MYDVNTSNAYAHIYMDLHTSQIHSVYRKTRCITWDLQDLFAICSLPKFVTFSETWYFESHNIRCMQAIDQTLTILLRLNSVRSWQLKNFALIKGRVGCISARQQILRWRAIDSFAARENFSLRLESIKCCLDKTASLHSHLEASCVSVRHYADDTTTLAR